MINVTAWPSNRSGSQLPPGSSVILMPPRHVLRNQATGPAATPPSRREDEKLARGSLRSDPVAVDTAADQWRRARQAAARLQPAAGQVMPLGQSRYLRITWVSRGCLAKQDIAGMDSVELRVRVGWTTRTEYIQFNEGFYLGHGGYCPR